MVADGFLTVGEAAKFSGLGRTTIYSLMERGQLEYAKIGKARRIPKRALCDFLVEHIVVRAQKEGGR